MRRWLSSPLLPDGAVLVLRLWLGAMMLWHGLPKFGRMEMFQKRVAELGFPMPEFFAWAAALSEVLGGVALLLGLGLRFVLPFVFVTMVVAAFGAHAADPFARKELPLTYAVLVAALWLLGAGRWSLDAWLSRQEELRR
jgi:putative oxidoreductase